MKKTILGTMILTIILALALASCSTSDSTQLNNESLFKPSTLLPKHETFGVTQDQTPKPEKKKLEIPETPYTIKIYIADDNADCDFCEKFKNELQPHDFGEAMKSIYKEGDNKDLALADGGFSVLYKEKVFVIPYQQVFLSDLSKEELDELKINEDTFIEVRVYKLGEPFDFDETQNSVKSLVEYLEVILKEGESPNEQFVE